MKRLKRITTSVAMFCVCAVFSAACVTTPGNGAVIGTPQSPVSVAGFSLSPQATVCVYASDARNGAYSLMAATTASASPVYLYEQPTYYFQAVSAIPAEHWKCDSPYNGKASAWIRVHDRVIGDCGTPPGDALLQYTYTDGVSPLDCFTANQNWVDFLEDCPRDPEHPNIRVTAPDPSCVLCEPTPWQGLSCESFQTEQQFWPKDRLGVTYCHADSSADLVCWAPDCDPLKSLSQVDSGTGLCTGGRVNVGVNPGILCDANDQPLICFPNTSQP